MRDIQCENFIAVQDATDERLATHRDRKNGSLLELY